MQRKQKITAQGKAEIVFDSVYLLFVIGAGIYMCAQSNHQILALYGALAIVLGMGDSFHLLPRIKGHIYGMERYQRSLGIGKMITSITMTMFYVLLYIVWLKLEGAAFFHPMGILIFILAAIRIVLCVLPQNGWRKKQAPVSWAVIRNIPFLMMGIIVMVLFWGRTDMFAFMPIAIFFSFVCYVPVVLWAGTHKKVGALMMPKTMAYMWMVCMGLSMV